MGEAEAQLLEPESIVVDVAQSQPFVRERSWSHARRAYGPWSPAAETRPADQLFRFEAQPSLPPPMVLAPKTTLSQVCDETPEPAERPVGLCVLPNGKVAIASEGVPKPTFVSDRGKCIKQPAKMPELTAPSAVACNAASFFIADAGSHQIVRLHLRNMALACEPAGGLGSGTGQLQRPTGLALLDGALFVSDCNNHRICRYHTLVRALRVKYRLARPCLPHPRLA
jgi:hypothetical protein